MRRKNMFRLPNQKYSRKSQRYFYYAIAVMFLLAMVESYPQFVFIIIIILSILISEYYKKIRIEPVRKSGIEDIDKMSGIDFEKRLEVLFKDMGYCVKRTSASGDFGADLVIEKYGVRKVVQAKRNNKPIGVKSIQETVASIAFYKANKAMVVTNQTFTKQAEKLATLNNVDLWDREKLIKTLNNYNNSEVKMFPFIDNIMNLLKPSPNK